MGPLRTRLEGVVRILREDGTFRAFLGHTGWLTGSNTLIMALIAIQGILTARMLGVAGWGMLAVALGFSEVVGRLLSFRMNEFVVKWVTQLRGNGTAQASTAFKFALAADVGSAFSAFVIVELLAGWGATTFAKNPEFAWAFRWTALTILFQAGRQTLTGMLHVNRDFRVQGLVQTGSQFASVCGMAVVYLTGGGVFGVVAVIVGAAALYGILLWTFGLRAARAVLLPGWLRQPLADFEGRGREMSRFAILGNLRGTLGSIMNDGDLLILGYLRSPTDVAYYKLAKSIAQIASIPNGPLVSAAYPEFATAVATESWGKLRSLMRRGSKVAALWEIPVSIVLIILAQPAIALLYGPTFLPAVPVLAILLIGAVVDGVLFWGTSALLALGEAGQVASIALWGMAAKLALAFLLVPAGGSLALAAAHSLVLVGMNAASTRRTLMSLRVRESLSHV